MKLKVKDMDGKVFEITDAGCDEKKVDDTKMKDEELTAAEIKKLKKLIPHLDELLTILESEDEKKDFDADELEVDEDADVDESVTVEESVEDDADIEEDEEVKVVRDSKASFGSISRKAATKVDDEIAQDEDIATTWAKYYGGK